MLQLNTFLSADYNVFVHEGQRIVYISIGICNYWKSVPSYLFVLFDIVAKQITKNCLHQLQNFSSVKMSTITVIIL